MRRKDSAIEITIPYKMQKEQLYALLTKVMMNKSEYAINEAIKWAERELSELKEMKSQTDGSDKKFQLLQQWNHAMIPTPSSEQTKHAMSFPEQLPKNLPSTTSATQIIKQ